MRNLIITALCACLTITASAADKPAKPIPDLTKGQELTRINKRWVGPVGIYCGAWRPRQRSDEQKYVRQLLVLEVDKGSPADGALEVGDVILGADGSGATKVPLFKRNEWAMIPIAEAITQAEARNPALLKLLIWRSVSDKKQDDPVESKPAPAKRPTLDDINLDDLEAGLDSLLEARGRSVKKVIKKTVDAKVTPKIAGKIQTVTIKLETLGAYSDTAPYNCPKSRRILRKGVKALYESNDPGKFSLGILCLLAADDPSDPDNTKYQARAKEWAHLLIAPSAEEVRPSPWMAGYHLIVLSEYYMKTKDKAVFPTLTFYAEHFAKGQSWFGTTGHRYCEMQPDGSGNGRIAGYGPISASGVAGFFGLVMAREAGVKSPRVDAAIKRADIFFGHYAYKGGLNYGEMPYAIGGRPGDNNGKHATAAFAFGLQAGGEKKAKWYARMTALSTHQSRQYAHGGPFFGQVWQPLGAGLAGEKAAAVQFQKIRWHLDLKRRWDGSVIFDPTNNKYKGFCYAANTLLTYAMPLRQLYITGRDQKKSLQLNDAEFDELIATDKFDPAKATTQELLAALSGFHGMLRTPAGEELARRTSESPDSAEWPALLDKLLAMAADSNASPTGRTGACYALMVIKKLNGKKRTKVWELKNTECAKTLVGLLKDPNPYVRFGGVRALQALDSQAVMPHVDAIMDAAVATARATFPLDREDPLQWAHGEMGSLLFRGLLNKSIDGVDRAKLLPAIRACLQTPNGHARNSTGTVLDKLTRDETLQVADVIVDNVMVAPPGNAMGGSPAPNSQAVLAKHMIEEALPLSTIYGASDAIKNKIPQKYGKAALDMQSANKFLQSLGDQILVKGVDAQGIVDGIKTGASPEKMYKLKRIDSIKADDTTLTLPATKTHLLVDATNFGRRGANETTYTWRKVYGAGKVSFTPNASEQSKKTTVTFTDKKPGKYRFEVAMSDTLGLSVLRKTVDVTLYDTRGKLPGNNPPKATSQSLSATPGLPVRINLSGTDPDGDNLGFAVTKAPAHGTLSGVDGELTYTANFGHNGTDRFSFKAIDGQGKTATGTVNFKVSDQNVGVAIYEGFDYPEGAVLGQAGSKSFGFNGRWKNSRSTKDWYVVAAGSNSYADLPSTGGKLTKGKGWWPCSRSLDPAVLAACKLLKNGSELWFSVIVQPAGGKSQLSFGLNGGDGKGALTLDSRSMGIT
ncbi:MAG: cadherin-like domain-containing protein [Phycisphaerales bacterium]|jgi:hypothetical protein|nr:cadherin-like domain-containing protein [Phycisphaerales bacterium]